MSQVLQEVLIADPTSATILKQPANLYQRSIYTLLKPGYFLRALVLRLFWHAKAYGTIVGVMVLALLSIGGLWLYETGHKLLQRRLAAPSHYAELNSSNQR